MSFATKFAIVGIVILLPLGYLTFAYVGLKASQVDFSSREQVGVKYLTPVNALLGQVVQARSANVASLATGGAAKSTDFSANIQAVDKVDSKYGHSLDTTQMWLNVKNEVSALPAQKFDNAKSAFDAYTKVTTDVQGLITEAGNNSNLILDPDLDSFYVMDSFVVQAPALIDVAGQFADTKFLASDGSDHATDIAVLQGQVSSRNAALATDAATAFKNTKNSKLKGAMSDALAGQQNAVNAVLGNNNPDATSANNSLNATNSYSTVIGPQLTHLIDVRDAAFISNERQVEAIALICTLIAIGMFVSMVRWLNSSIRSIINPLEESSSQLQVMGGLMASNTRATATQAQGASATADEVSSNVQMIAAALEEMEATVREVANSASSVSNIAVSASSSAEHANATISKLGDSSQEIGKVLDVIASIADQTNLLALNATIEAARAGDAGKGFAVVASEVKDLAKETASATEEISGRITQIQHDTQLSVQAIGEITRIIEEIKEAQLSIAGAVEEQQVTTTEISRNVVDSAQGVGNIAEVIREVASTARATSDGIEGVLEKAGELTGVAGDVNDIIYGTGKNGGSQGPSLESSHRQQPRRDFEDTPGRTRPDGQDRQQTYLNQ